MPPVSVGVPLGVETQCALLHPHGGGEARVHLGEAELGQRRPRWRRRGAPEHAHGRPRSRRRRAVRVTASEECRATWGKSQRSGGTPASGRARRSRSGAPTPGRPSTGWRATVVRIGERAVVRSRRWRCSPPTRGSPNAADGVVGATALKRAQSAAISSRWRSPGPAPRRRPARSRSARTAGPAATRCRRPPPPAPRSPAGRVRTSSGGLVLLVGLDAAVACPGPGLGPGDDDRVEPCRRPPPPARR